ncbi:hypothetical protein HOD08_02795 [bacterium]|nr:hypothetical protein [bacterium]
MITRTSDEPPSSKIERKSIWQQSTTSKSNEASQAIKLVPRLWTYKFVKCYKIGKLKYLSLDNNKIKILPKEITRLQNLVWLSLDGNQINFVHTEITDWLSKFYKKDEWSFIRTDAT